MQLRRGHKTKIDPYGAMSPPEFFAVVTEMFFEKPGQLKRHHPKRYDELANFYQQDRARD